MWYYYGSFTGSITAVFIIAAFTPFNSKLSTFMQLQITRLNVLRKGVWFVDIPRASLSSIRSEMGEVFGAPYVRPNLINKKMRLLRYF